MLAGLLSGAGEVGESWMKFDQQMTMLREKMAMESEQRRSDKEWEIGKAEELRKQKTGAIRDLARGASEADIDSRLGQAEQAYIAAGQQNNPEVQAALADARSRNKGGLLFSPSTDDMVRAEAEYEGDYKTAATLEATKSDRAERAADRDEDRAMRRDHYKAMERQGDARIAARGSGGDASSAKKADIDAAVKDYNRALMFMKNPDPEGRAKSMLDGAVAKLASLGVKVGEKGDPLSSTVSAAKAIIADDDAPQEAKDAARAALTKAVGGAATSSGDRFVAGKAYKDRNGNVRTYKGNGQWE